MLNFLAIVVAVLITTLFGLWIFGERGHLILPSTLDAMPKRGGKKKDLPEIKSIKMPQRKPGLLDPLHAYLYGRWTNQYISVLLNWLMPRFSKEQREQYANAYHGKVLTHELASDLITLDHDVDARNLEHIIPYAVARDVILSSPLQITLYECACRHARPGGGCKPSDVCMAISGGPHDFLVEHNPHSARTITQDQALEILRAEHERGHLHSAWFKDVLGNRMFAICNCCKCCCGGIEGMVKFGARTMVSSGYVACVDEANCTACGMCVDHCPFDAITLDGTLASVNRDKCMGCGVCSSQCAFEGIALVRDETKPAPLDVHVL